MVQASMPLYTTSSTKAENDLNKATLCRVNSISGIVITHFDRFTWKALRWRPSIYSLDTPPLPPPTPPPKFTYHGMFWELQGKVLKWRL